MAGYTARCRVSAGRRCWGERRLRSLAVLLTSTITSVELETSSRRAAVMSMARGGSGGRRCWTHSRSGVVHLMQCRGKDEGGHGGQVDDCLLYTSDAADDLLCVDLGGRRI